MDSQDQEKQVHESVLSAIKQGDIKMRPRWQFILRTMLAVVGLAILMLALIYLISLILFMMSETGAGFVPAFGSRGWLAFARSLPWLMILLAVAFIIVLEVLVRRYAFAYRRPLLYSMLGIVALSILSGVGVAGTLLHRRISNYAYQHRVPFFDQLYENVEEQQLPEIYPGQIVQLMQHSFLLEGRRGDTVEVLISPETMFSVGTQFATSDMVVVFGEPATGTIQAFGIRKLENHGWSGRHVRMMLK